MFERFGSPCVIAAASVIVLAATPAAAQGTPDATQPATPPPAGTGAPTTPAAGAPTTPAAAPTAPAAGAGASGSLGTGLSLGASAEAPAAPAAPAAEPKPEEKKWEGPTAGYNGAFFVRSKDDLFQLAFNGRLQFDFVKPFAAGAYPANQFSSFIIRRARVEFSGGFGKFGFSIQPEFGPSNSSGTNQAPVARTSAMLPTAFINYAIMPELQIMMGNVQTPFGLETRTTSKYKDFLEDGISTKFAVPNAIEQGITLWGATDKNMINYEVGVFGGDSGARANVDNRFDFIGRFFVRPMAQNKGTLEKLQVGVSGRYGTRDTKKVNYDHHGITTNNGYSLWGPTYTGTAPGGAVTSGLTHIIPSGAQTAFGAELRVPVENFDLTGEFFYVNNKTREEYDARLGSGNYERYGELSGTAFYAQASYWLGKRDINGEPGFFRYSKMKFAPPAPKKEGEKPKGPDTAWRFRVRYDNVSAKYEGAKESGTIADRAVAGQSAPRTAWYDGDIKVHALQAGVDYFFTKHAGLRLNYGLYYTPDSAPTSLQPGFTHPVASDANRAAAPANRLAAGINDDARRGSHSIHELILRAQVAF